MMITLRKLRICFYDKCQRLGHEQVSGIFACKKRYIIKKKIENVSEVRKKNKNYKIKNYSTFENYKVALC